MHGPRQVALATFLKSSLINMQSDENRGYLLEAGLPQALVSLLEAYAEPITTPPIFKLLDLSISHLKVIKTAIGVLLNASIGFGTEHNCRACLILILIAVRSGQI
jgi:hypothetical protein